MYHPSLTDIYRSSYHPLPSPLQALLQGGRLPEAAEMIRTLLAQDIPDTLRARLLLETRRIDRLPRLYPYTRADILAQLRQAGHPISDGQLQQWEDEGRIDFRYIGGQKMYFEDVVPSLQKNGTLPPLPQPPAPAGECSLDDMIQEIMTEREVTYRITAQHAIRPESFTAQPLIAHLPYPLERDQQHHVQLLDGTPHHIAGTDALQRTASWRGMLSPQASFHIRYQYDVTLQYARPLTAPAPDQPLYPDAPPPVSADLECPDPAIRALAQTLTEGIASPAAQAWAFYRYITERCTYAFVPDYMMLDHLETYVLLHRQGDCGLQALLFIHLCRSAGIPARWQSGMCINGNNSLGSHDWAQFYLPGWGWLFCDPSYGGGAFRRGQSVRHAFYFGNIDPARMAANADYLAPFVPDFPAFRHDPTDSQSGEIALVGAADALLPHQRVAVRKAEGFVRIG